MVERASAFAGKNVVITAGPTREYLDDIRFLSNASTGRMGYELARAAARQGAEVTMILGPSNLKPLRDVHLVEVVSTNDMLKAARTRATRAEVMIFAAAPSDWKPTRRRRGKTKREGGDFELALTATPDVAARLGRRKGGRVHVGFALEVGGGIERALRKMARKRLDAIVLNSPANFGLGGGEAHWIAETGATHVLPTKTKAHLARAILSRTAALLR